MPFPDALPVDERIQMARQKAAALSRYVTSLIQTNANNRSLVYSPRLSRMLGPSFAAHALADLQRASFAMELSRLCALWDSPRADRISLPTIAHLIAHTEVIGSLRRDHAAGWGDPNDLHLGNEDELTPDDVAYFREVFRRRNDEFVEKNFRHNLRLSLCGVQAVSASSRLRDIFNHRDRFIAHNLEAASLARAGQPFVAPRYGYERKLLRTTERLANALSVVCNNSSFAYSHSRAFAIKNSESFFGAIRLQGAI